MYLSGTRPLRKDYFENFMALKRNIAYKKQVLLPLLCHKANFESFHDGPCCDRALRVDIAENPPTPRKSPSTQVASVSTP
jgi:hypothetical protein